MSMSITGMFSFLVWWMFFGIIFCRLVEKAKKIENRNKDENKP